MLRSARIYPMRRLIVFIAADADSIGIVVALTALTARKLAAHA